MNTGEKSLIHVADPSLRLKLWHCCCCILKSIILKSPNTEISGPIIQSLFTLILSIATYKKKALLITFCSLFSCCQRQLALRS